MFATNKDIIPIFLRLTLGAVMFPHGAQKVLGWFGGAFSIDRALEGPQK